METLERIKPVTAKSKPAPAPSQTPLQAAVAEAEAAVVKLRDEFARQAGRLMELPRLEIERDGLLAVSEGDAHAPDADAARLAVIQSKMELAVHGIRRRGTGLAEEFPAVRKQLVELKRQTLEGLASAQREQIRQRQEAVASFMAGWGGTAPAAAAYVAAIGPLMQACPTISALERLRSTIDAWSSMKPASALLNAASEAADLLAKRGYKTVVVDESAESSLQDPYAVLAWSPGRDSWDLYATFAGRTEAAKEFNWMESCTVLGGFRRYILLSPNAAANSQRFPNPHNQTLGEVASDRNYYHQRGYTEADERFLDDGAAWTAPASSSPTSTITAA